MKLNVIEEPTTTTTSSSATDAGDCNAPAWQQLLSNPSAGDRGIRIDMPADSSKEDHPASKPSWIHFPALFGRTQSGNSLRAPLSSTGSSSVLSGGEADGAGVSLMENKEKAAAAAPAKSRPSTPFIRRLVTHLRRGKK